MAALTKAITPIVCDQQSIMAEIAKILENTNGLLIKFFKGMSNLNLQPDNLIKAAIDPVKVIPPINDPRQADTACKLEGSISIIYDDMLVVTLRKIKKK